MKILYNKEMNIVKSLTYPNYLTFLTYQRYSTIEYIVPGKERYKAIPPTAFNDDLLPLLRLMMTKSRIVFFDPYCV